MYVHREMIIEPSEMRTDEVRDNIDNSQVIKKQQSTVRQAHVTYSTVGLQLMLFRTFNLTIIFTINSRSVN